MALGNQAVTAGEDNHHWKVLTVLTLAQLYQTAYEMIGSEVASVTDLNACHQLRNCQNISFVCHPMEAGDAAWTYQPQVSTQMMIHLLK